MNSSNIFNSVNLRAALISLACALALTLSGNLLAASSCKGQTQNACTTNNSCSWIKSYKKKNDSKVTAYCRTKSKKKKSANATQTKKTNINKDSKSTANKKPKETKKIIKKKTTTS